MRTPNKGLSIAVSFSTPAIPCLSLWKGVKPRYEADRMATSDRNFHNGSTKCGRSAFRTFCVERHRGDSHLKRLIHQISVVLRCLLHALVYDMKLKYEGLFWGGYILQVEHTWSCYIMYGYGGDAYTISCVYTGFQLHLNVMYCVGFHSVPVITLKCVSVAWPSRECSVQG